MDRIQIAKVLVRELSNNFTCCLRQDKGLNIDLKLAKRQHQGYCALLREAGFRVEVLEALHRCPDCVFIEDTALVLDHESIIVLRQGAQSRRDEATSLTPYYQEHFSYVYQMFQPATCDGGDILRVGTKIVAGLSTRTNSAGLDFIAGIAKKYGITLRRLPLAHGLHLKSFMTLASEDILILHESLREYQDLLTDYLGVTVCLVSEPVEANVLALGEGRVLTSRAASLMAAKLASLGLKVMDLDFSELHKGDGCLTCPSIRIPKAGSWAT